VALPERRVKPQLAPFSARVPPELRAGVDWWARLYNMDFQEMAAKVIEAGLQAQFGQNWRELLDAEVRSWRPR
jgi:hypothetical protein